MVFKKANKINSKIKVSYQGQKLLVCIKLVGLNFYPSDKNLKYKYFLKWQKYCSYWKSIRFFKTFFTNLILNKSTFFLLLFAVKIQKLFSYRICRCIQFLLMCFCCVVNCFFSTCIQPINLFLLFLYI